MPLSPFTRHPALFVYLRRQLSIAFRLLLLSSALLTFGCEATYIRASVENNPLDRVVQQAKKDWTVERVDENTLHLRNVWPIISAASFGYAASYANLVYNPSFHEIDLQYYMRTNSLFFLFIPFYGSAEPKNAMGATNPVMEQQIVDLMTWSGTAVKFRRVGSESEPFPPYANTPPTAKK